MKNGSNFVQCFFRDGVVEVMSNASCFLISFLVVFSYIFSKRQVKPLFVQYNFSNLSIKISYSTYKCTQMVNTMTLISDPKWCESVKQGLSGQSLRPTHHCILSRPPHLQSPILGSQKKNHYASSLMHQQRSFTILCSSTLHDNINLRI